MGTASPYGRIHVKYDGYEQNEQTALARSMGKREKLNLMLTSGVIGICIILFHFSSELFVKIIKATPIIDHYYDGSVFIYTVQMFYSMFSIVLPFALGGFMISKFIQKDTTLLPLNKPNSGKKVLIALAISFLTLVVTNFISALFLLGGESLGFEFEGGESPTPNSFYELLWEELSTAAVPALVEEFAIRGVVLQSLRRFGDRFAIVTSAFIFSIMHGNMVQAPFAFVLGVVIAYMVIITESMWTGVFIHLMNNTYAVLLTSASAWLPQMGYVAIVLVVDVIGVVLGIVALLLFLDHHRADHPLSEPCGNTRVANKKYRRQAFFYTVISLPMLAALILMIVEIAGTVTYVG